MRGAQTRHLQASVKEAVLLPAKVFQASTSAAVRHEMLSPKQGHADLGWKATVLWQAGYRLPSNQDHELSVSDAFPHIDFPTPSLCVLLLPAVRLGPGGSLASWKGARSKDQFSVAGPKTEERQRGVRRTQERWLTRFLKTRIYTGSVPCKLKAIVEQLHDGLVLRSNRAPITISRTKQFLPEQKP